MPRYIDGKLILEATIKKDIPLPFPKGARTDIYEKAKLMQVGDCLEVPNPRRAHASNLARSTGYEFTQKKIGDILRIWRTK
jgi:hypothetical protein